MKIKTDPTIQSMSGRFPGSRLVMINPKGKLITNARAYVIPDNLAQQEAFAAKVAVLVTIWNTAHADFKADAELYKSWYNANVITNEEIKFRPMLYSSKLFSQQKKKAQPVLSSYP